MRRQSRLTGRYDRWSIPGAVSKAGSGRSRRNESDDEKRGKDALMALGTQVASAGDGRVRTVERLIRALLACALFLTVLFLWRQWFARSCLALVFPLMLYGAVFYGLLEHRLERRRFALDYYLNVDSTLRNWLRGRSVPVMVSLFLAAPLTALLAVFAALSRPTDWYFLGPVALAAPLVFTLLALWPGGHFRQDTGRGARRVAPADVLEARIAGVLVLAGVVITYWYANYYLIPVPDGIFPGSLEQTLGVFSAAAASRCRHVETILSVAARLDGLVWYSATTAVSSGLVTDGMKGLLWAAFFTKSAMALGGFVQGLNGSILLACRTVGTHREAGS